MSLIFMDGFDHYASADLLQKWSAASAAIALSVTYSRWASGMGARNSSNAYMQKNIANTATIIAGTAVCWNTSLPLGGALISLMDGSTTQVYLKANTDGTLSVVNGDGTVLGTSTLSFSINIWHYVELKSMINNSTGYYEVRVNGVTWIIGSNKDTQNTANAYANSVRIGFPTSNTLYIDDLYICDTTGALNNDFLGDVRVQTVYPNADGTNTAWIPSTGTDDFAVVDEEQHNADTDYLYSSTLNARETLNVTNVSVNGGNIFAVQHNIVVRKDDAGDRSIKPVIKSGSTYDQGAEVPLSTTYSFVRKQYETDPNTSAAWTETNLNAAEFGVDLTV